LPKRGDETLRRSLVGIALSVVLVAGCAKEPPQFLDTVPENNTEVKVKIIPVKGKVVVGDKPAGSATVSIAITRMDDGQLVSKKHLKTNSQGGFISTVPLYTSKMDASGKMNTDVYTGKYEIALSTSVDGAEGKESIYVDVLGIDKPVASAPAPAAPQPAAPDKPAPVKPTAPNWGAVEQAGDRHLAQRRYADALSEWQRIPQGQGSSQLPAKIADAQARRQYAPVEQAGDNLFASEQYDDAIAKWETIPDAYRPQQKIADANRLKGEQAARYRQIEADGDSKLASGDARGAYDTWTKIPERFRSDALKAKMEGALAKVADGADRAKWAKAEAQADRKLSAKDYRGALKQYETIPADYASPELGNKQMEAMEGAQWLDALDEGDALYGKQEYSAALAKWESIPAKFQPESLPGKVQEAQSWLNAQRLETAGDAAGTLGNWENALASYQAVPEGFGSAGLAGKLEKAAAHVKWLDVEKAADALYEKRDLASLKQAKDQYTSVQSAGYGSAELPGKIGKVDQLINDIIEKGDPFGKGKGLADAGDYAGAIESFESVDPSSKDYVSSKWNVALLSMGEEAVQDFDRSLAALQEIAKKANNVYVYYYRGVARYQKARSYKDILNSKDALDDFRRALEMFDEAGARSDGFARLKIEGVPSLPPEESMTYLDYYQGATYYFLHQFGKYDPLVPEETLNGYKLNARNKLGQYIRRSRKLQTESVRRFVPEAQTFIKQLRQS